MTEAALYLAGLLVVAGSFFILTAAIGLIRLPDVYTRMHAASKAGTMGSCVMLLALAVSSADWSISTRALAGIVFFLITVPISAHLLARAAHIAGYPLAPAGASDELAVAVNTPDGGGNQDS